MPNRVTNNQRRALEMLARVPHGPTEGAMFAHEFGADTLAGLALAGLVMVVTETVRTGGPTAKAERFMITDAGQRAIAAPGP